MNCFNEKEFNDVKNKVENQYKAIDSIFSPALKSEIVFNSNGLHHLKYDNHRSERAKSVQMNKFKFFSDGLKIIQKSTTIQEYRRNVDIVDEKEKITEWFAFWAIISFIRKIRVKVIVRRLGGESGKFHFWSVMPYWSLRKKEKEVGSPEIEDD